MSESRTALRQALAEALDDEYKAMATYEAVIAAFGPVRPFVNIVEAERRHADALLQLHETYDIEPQPNRWRGTITPPATLVEACAAGVAAEIENAELYDRLMAMVDLPDVLRVFTALRDASQQRHLDAFRRCVARQSGEMRADGCLACDPGVAAGPGRHRHRGAGQGAGCGQGQQRQQGAGQGTGQGLGRGRRGQQQAMVDGT
jgi:rubrerythrin